MGDLSNKFIDESYGSLLKTTEDTGLSGTTKTNIQDGNGVDTALSLSTDKVDVNGELQTSGTTRVQGDGTLVNVSGDVSQFTNDAGYLDGLPVDVLRIGDNISELNNNSGYLTAGTIPSNVMKEGENVSLLTNNAGYLTELTLPSNIMKEGENNSLLNNDSGYISSIPNTYLESGDNVSELVNDSGYLTSIPSNVMLEGENNSLLNNDSGFITGINTGVIQVSGGGGIQQSQQALTDQDGTATGQFIWPIVGAAGIENDTSISDNANYLVKNNNFDKNTSPMASSGAAGFWILDQNNDTTFNINQNRFGGVNYYNYVQGQDHIFGGNQSGLIRMNTFNSDNNSDNWYEGYNQNITDITLTGQDLEFNTRAGANVATITLPSGGGGGLHPVVSGGYYGNQWNYSPNMTTATGYGQRILIRPVYFRAGEYDAIHAWYQTASSQSGSFNRYAVYNASTTSHLFIGDTNMPQPTTKLIDVSIPATNSGGQNVGLSSGLDIPADGIYIEAYIYDNGVDNTMSGGFSSLTNSIPYNTMFGRDLPFKSPFAGSKAEGITHAISNGVVYTSFPSDLSSQTSWSNTSIAPGFNWSIL